MGKHRDMVLFLCTEGRPSEKASPSRCQEVLLSLSPFSAGFLQPLPLPALVRRQPSRVAAGHGTLDGDRAISLSPTKNAGLRVQFPSVSTEPLQKVLFLLLLSHWCPLSHKHGVQINPYFGAVYRLERQPRPSGRLETEQSTRAREPRMSLEPKPSSHRNIGLPQRLRKVQRQ